MALKALLLRKKIDAKKKELEALRQKDPDFEKREAELTAAIEEAETDEEKAGVEELVDAYEAEAEAHTAKKAELEREVGELESELEEEERAQDPAPAPIPKKREREVYKPMETRFAIMSHEQRAAVVSREDVKGFLDHVREMGKQSRAVTNAGLLIPDVMLELIRHEIAGASRLLPFVNRRTVSGNARQNIAGAIPEAVWTEMCANLNELALTFNQIEVDGYKVGGYIAVCNAVLQDSDINLANEIITAIGGAIAKALDKAILFGTGTKMPIGIVTRLAQTSQPANWEANAPTWTDLHTSNVKKLNIDSSTGEAFFTSLIEALAVAQPYYNGDGLFWVMNRKTHLHVLAKALKFNANAALVANTELMPIIGGTVVEFEDDEISDNEIIGGFGGNYLLAERAGVEFASSDIPLFLQDQTVYKGTARYDGKPLAGEAFVIVNFANTNPTTSKTFPEDYANTDLNDLIVTAATGATAGKTVLTVSGTIEQSTPVLQYKLGTPAVNAGDVVTGWDDLTSGSTAITAAAGKKITVVELDGNGRVVSAGVVASVPKTT